MDAKILLRSTDLQGSVQGLFAEGQDWFASFSDRKSPFSVCIDLI